MHRLCIAATFVLLMTVCGCQSGSTSSAGRHIQAPVAQKKPRALEKHGHIRIDDYYWLNQRENPQVIDYLNAENKYTDAMTSHTKRLQNKLFKEIKGRIKQDDTSVPYLFDGYYYYTRYEDGEQYPLHCRKKGSLDAIEELMLDVNKMAHGHEYFSVRGRKVSSQRDILAYAEDTRGRRIYTIRFKNLTTGQTLVDTIPNVTGNMAWANDNRTLFYTKQDPQTLRSYQIYRHVLGTNASRDVLVYEEQDDTFSTFVTKTKSQKYILIGCRHTLSSEYRYLDADDPTGQFAVFLPRERDHEYSLSHFKDRFYIRTNWQADNFRLMSTRVGRNVKENWEEVIEHRKDVMLLGIDIFADHLVVEERQNGLVQIRIMPWDGSRDHYLAFDEPTYRAYVGTNREFDTNTLRFGYTSMTTPNSTFDYDMKMRKKVLMKQDEVLGGFSSDNYRTERLYASAGDGTQVPISIVYRKGLKKDGSNPLLLYGYGSYGASMDATFSSPRVSLLDRGFVYAIAHIRGGQELGRHWYEDGKLFTKKNTFTDFISCGEYLIRAGFTTPSNLYAMGGSAGGLLMGAVVNMRPDLFHGVVARVPFVDVITTMLDDSIPLTTSEYDEWGDPNKKEYYDYILSYSPYDNVEARNYPNMLVTTGLHDSQVQYWEPAKWVARLRAVKTGDNQLLLKTNMDSGHGGASGRYERYRQTAFYYAFLLDLAGIRS